MGLRLGSGHPGEEVERVIIWLLGSENRAGVMDFVSSLVPLTPGHSSGLPVKVNLVGRQLASRKYKGNIVTEYVARNIGEFTDALVNITRQFGNRQLWWRGQIEESWRLVPRLYREDLADSEVALNTRFRNLAVSRYHRTPGQDDLFGWLSLMQHYRLPTRLLDWSESPLVGLFFALEESSTYQGDSIVWALLPVNLSLEEFPGRGAIFSARSSDIQMLFHGAFYRNEDLPRDSRILAVEPPQMELRHMVQQSTFTIHGRITPIDELPGQDSFLARIRIPADSRTRLRQTLKLYGISRAILFPDLENLSKELESLKYAPIA